MLEVIKVKMNGNKSNTKKKEVVVEKEIEMRRAMTAKDKELQTIIAEEKTEVQK